MVFSDIEAYRVSTKCAGDIKENYSPNVDKPVFFRVENSSYIKWLEDSGWKWLNGEAEIGAVHYKLETIEQIIDVVNVKGHLITHAYNSRHSSLNRHESHTQWTDVTKSWPVISN